MVAALAIVLVVIVILSLVLARSSTTAQDHERSHDTPERKEESDSSSKPLTRRSNAMNQQKYDANGRNTDLGARKAINTFDFILKSYGQQTWWPTANDKEDYIHDLAVMLNHNDLVKVSLEILAADRTVLYRHAVQFNEQKQWGSVDGAQGIELPLIDRVKIADRRLLVSPARRTDEYRSELRNNWSRAEKLRDQVGTSFESEHTRRIYGGRGTAEVFVTDGSRHEGIILNVSTTGDYAFVRDAILNTDVFVHRNYCFDGLPLRPGCRVSFVPIQTPRGVQARGVRAA